MFGLIYVRSRLESYTNLPIGLPQKHCPRNCSIQVQIFMTMNLNMNNNSNNVHLSVIMII